MNRERRRAALDRLERLTDAPLTVLSVALAIILVVPLFVSPRPQTARTIEAIGWVIWAVFAADLALKLAIAPERGAFLRRRWFDALLVVVPVLRPLRAARSIRAIRLIAAGAAVTRVAVVGRELWDQRGLRYVLVVAAGAVLLGGTAVAIAEVEEQDATIDHLWDGLWWAIATVTTVGYGDEYPTTLAGRAIAVVLMVVGIALFGVVAGTLSSLLVGQRDDEVLAALRRIESRLDALERRAAGEEPR